MGKQGRVIVKQQKAPGAQMASALKAMTSPDEDAPRIPIYEKSILFCSPREISNTMEYTRYETVWPNFLDSTKTIAQGRRIAKADACEGPTVMEMSMICSSLFLWHAVEPNRGYPREPYVRGRLRVRLKVDGRPVNPQIPDKMALLKFLGKTIPHHPARKERLAKEAAEKEQLEKEKAASAKQAQATASSAGSNKKKSKKGRKK